VSATAQALQTQFRLLDPRPFRPRPAAPSDPPPVETREREEVSRLRAALAGTAAAKVVNGTELLRALQTSRHDGVLPTTLHAIDTLLGGGLARGTMTEITGRRTSGRFSIVLSTLASVTSMGEAAALIDLGDHLDPQLAEADGVDLRRLLWIRPKTLRQAVMSAELVTAAGFSLIALDTGLHPLRGRRVPDASWVRLARAAERRGAVLLVSAPYAMTGTSSEAVLAAMATRVEWCGRGLAPRVLSGVSTQVRLEKHRHRRAGTSVPVELEAQP
jgi:hypothetical protein